MIGYWFAAGTTLPNGDGRAVVIGETLTVDPPLVMCEHGLHASVYPYDALQYAKGNLLYKVRLSGEILTDEDKCCATERSALAMIDATVILRLFSRRQALSVIHLWNPPTVARQYLETGDEMIRAAAQAAAWEAAWAPVGEQRRRSTAAEVAARAAAWAAHDAAWAGARAADAATWASTWDSRAWSTWNGT